jgi:hypothetical protein
MRLLKWIGPVAFPTLYSYLGYRWACAVMQRNFPAMRDTYAPRKYRDWKSSELNPKTQEEK